MNHTVVKAGEGAYEVRDETGELLGRVWRQAGSTFYRGGRMDLRSSASGWRFSTEGRHDYGVTVRTRAKAVEEVLRESGIRG